MPKKNKSVLILTNSTDDHTHLVVPALENLGGRVYRFDVDRIPSYFSLSIRDFGQYTKVSIDTPVGKISLDKINSIWVRRPYLMDFSKESPQEKLTVQETNSLMSSIPELASSNMIVVDKPSIIYRASKKLLQLQIAGKLGFIIPATLVTNLELEAKQFIKKYKGLVIIKVIEKGVSMAGKKSLFIYTTKFSRKMDLKLVRNCPTLFQKQIIKDADIRVTVIGRKIFAVEFDTHGLAGVGIDWRKAGEKIKKVPHRVIKLSPDLEKKILALLDFYGLNFGAIDMARTPDNKYVFFELNPAGQFLWLEEVTGLPLAQEMAKFLLGKF